MSSECPDKDGLKLSGTLLSAHPDKSVSITDKALVAAATLSNRYITDRYLPDKAIDLVDEACATIRVQMDSVPTNLDTLTREILSLEMSKMDIQFLK